MFEGKGLIIHNLPANGIFLGQRLNYYRVDWAAFKIHDGGSRWGDSRNVTREYVDDIRKVYKGPLQGWGYVYCDGLSDDGSGRRDSDGVPLNDRGNGIPTDEAEAAAGKLEELGLDGYIADWERQCEGHPDLVSRFAKMFSELSNLSHSFRAAFVWGSLNGHGQYPIDVINNEFLGGFATLMPMIYRPTWNADDIDEWVQRSGRSRLSPTLSIYANDFDGTKADAETCREYRGLNIWSGDAFMRATDLMPAQVRERSDWFRDLTLVDNAPVEDVGPGQYRDVIFKVAGDLVNAGHLAEGISYQIVTRYFKGELSAAEAIRDLMARIV